ncbi:hypothetical protein HCU74_08190 [Spongiibacter sp. KMU-166]|uniref:Restriction alleviation protein, Lar family n=1 Tax=Spongiibacter thalassae TaxID=2721624 RepID=A0ABX1GGQ1_9GAMM|nr:Lar family restriction alleviation protein [Spongiibacter thalassae]NKI17394.1 hypothetical protein [Spongiibacter thalassae]
MKNETAQPESNATTQQVAPNNGLLPCPFCGESPEIDMRRSYAPINGGHLGHQVAIYCHNCPADMSICWEDVPEATPEQLYDELHDRWNERAR